MTNIHKHNLKTFERLITENVNKIKDASYGQKYYKQHFNDHNYMNSLSISVTILMEYYKVDTSRAIESLTDGTKDNKIDLFYFDEENIEQDRVFDTKSLDLIIIQSKYANKSGTSKHIKQDDVDLCIETAKKILNGDIDTTVDSLLSDKVKELKEIQQQNDHPNLRIHLYFATNGIIADTIKNNAPQIDSIYIHFVDASNFGRKIITPETATLKVLTDKNLCNKSSDQIEGFVTETTLKYLADFYQKYDEKALLSSNVRYLLLKSNINKSISKTATDYAEHFWFLNNGVSIIAEQCCISPAGTGVYNLQLKHPSIINGGQTVALASKILKEDPSRSLALEKAKILVRAYTTMDREISMQIAQATNSQNPINVVNLKSNDPYQQKVVEYFSSNGIALIVKPGTDDLTDYIDNITNESLLQSYAALYGNEPAKAKTSKLAIFNTYFDKVFNEKQINDNNIAKKLYRSYFLLNLLKNSSIDKAWLKHGIYAFLYAIKSICPSLVNENICEKDTTSNFYENIPQTVTVIENVIQQKTSILKERFSYNNLFKSSEIKDLIDLEIEAQTK